MPAALPYLLKMKLPRIVRRHGFSALEPGYDQLAETEPARARLGGTMWYRPFGGKRTIALLHRADSNELRVEERWQYRKQTYCRCVHLGNDVYRAVDAANAAFDALFHARYRLYGKGAAMLTEAFGLNTAWLRGLLFSVKSALDVIKYHEKAHAQKHNAQAAELADAEARGLVPVVPVRPGPRVRQSGLAERQAAHA